MQITSPSRFAVGALLALAASAGWQAPLQGATFSTRVFATGAAINASRPDSVTFGAGSLWVEYGNGASATGSGGSSTIVQYTTSGSVLNTYSIPGLVDGLTFNPVTGQVWALQNQDANSTLTVIDPASRTTSSFSYGLPYSAVSGSRGFDDVAFVNGRIFLSETNPASPGDAVVVELTNTSLSSPLSVRNVLTGEAVTATDPDSLKASPNGGLILSGEDDRTLVFINNPGQLTQSTRTLNLVTATGAPAGLPDDAVFATADSGTFYVADTGANVVYAITASGLAANSSLFVNAGTDFNSVDQLTGVVSPIFTGTSPHGLAFVASVDAVPEPASFGIAALALLSLSAIVRNRSSRGA